MIAERRCRGARPRSRGRRVVQVGLFVLLGMAQAGCGDPDGGGGGGYVTQAAAEVATAQAAVDAGGT